MRNGAGMSMVREFLAHRAFLSHRTRNRCSAGRRWGWCSERTGRVPRNTCRGCGRWCRLSFHLQCADDLRGRVRTNASGRDWPRKQWRVRLDGGRTIGLPSACWTSAWVSLGSWRILRTTGGPRTMVTSSFRARPRKAGESASERAAISITTVTVRKQTFPAL